MNRKQKATLYVIGICLIALFLFPPFTIDGGGAILNVGHHFFLIPPESYDFREGAMQVNSFLLLVQSLVLCMIGSIFYLAFSTEKSQSNSVD
ncbi:MAG: hypothetical protein ACLFV2_11725 [Desulfurivibrionaceae bacterium]